MNLIKINFAGLVLFWALFSAKFSFAQHLTLIDTLNIEHKRDLEAFYLQKSTETKTDIKNIENKEVRRELERIYQENQIEFSAEIKKGIFVKEAKYENLIQEIFNNLKKANSEIQDMKILLALSKEPNAYNNGEDIVVVNLPLLMEINNEYELAFIISHEIAHQRLNHVKKGTLKYVETSYSDQNKLATKNIQKQKYNKSQNANLALKKIIYGNREVSRKREIEADSLGFVFFNKAYPKQNSQAISTLTLLDNIDKEKDSLTENDYKLLFDTEKQPFKRQWIVNDELNNYQYDTAQKFWQIDSLKTHPDCVERISLLKKNFKSELTNTGVDESKYSPIKKASRYDVIVGLYFIKDYGDSLYQTLLLLKHNPDDLFLRKMVYDNLVKIQEAQIKYTLNKHLETINPLFSNSYNTYLYFIRKLRKAELENIIESYKY
jgi:Zn-dependent protease with chaperone function